MPTKVLLDTDIGSDIDDAVALAYLLANPSCDLLGITTVTGDTVQRASLASVLCKIAGRRIPIHPGARRALLTDQKQPHVPQAAALERWGHDTEFSRNSAIDFLRQTIRENPGEVVLFGIGPMTNIAALFAADEDIAGLLKGLVLMCGVFTSGPREKEWNALVDPTATAIVYRASPPFHRSVGLDVTRKVTMSAEEVRQKFDAPLLGPVLDFAEVWFKGADCITFHDPLAAAVIFENDICGFERGEVQVELRDEKLAGRTHWAPSPQGRHEVATTVNARRFFEHYFSFFKSDGHRPPHI